ncbi:hypothetical protein P8625_05890 [Tenacibaculum tangerinum]|uniref:Uncharacterized protein n=1 Tax=Tenacibaculum tangerinum TaxID=3038772 RepID=A0ABY8L5J5_9FLAO|nr:hypothetical protein [Tenacibaculum tangerinum]WGH76688.1 hypothetical protein P8625_05890 [Tenacibaculum tangerinum]
MEIKRLEYYKILLVFFVVIAVGCSSNDDEDCVKTITIPQFYIVWNQTYRYDIEQEVPCDVEEIIEPIKIAPLLLEGFTYEVVRFEYTPDTGNNTSRLQFEIKLNNPNNYAVNGVAYFRILSDDLEFSTNYENLVNPPCTTLEANSSCTVTLDVEENRDLGYANSFELLDVEYYITN